MQKLKALWERKEVPHSLKLPSACQLCEQRNSEGNPPMKIELSLVIFQRALISLSYRAYVMISNQIQEKIITVRRGY